MVRGSAVEGGARRSVDIVLVWLRRIGNVVCVSRRKGGVEVGQTVDVVGSEARLRLEGIS